MDKIWTEMDNAAKAGQNAREISEEMSAGGVAAERWMRHLLTADPIDDQSVL